MVIAEKTQIPNVETKAAGSNETSKLPTRDSRDTYWAHIRRLTARIGSLETEVSTLRRDINATRRKVYREEEKLPSTDAPATKSLVDEGITGLPADFWR